MAAAAAGIGTATAFGQARPSPEGGRLDRPINLTCEYRTNPLGIDVARPRLTWEVNDTRRGAVQTAYEIVVSTEESLRQARHVVWDTGKVESDRTTHVVYEGQPLESGTRYYWHVRTWDTDGRASEFSDTAWWEMGLLESDDWQGKWITCEPPKEDDANPEIEGAHWIWNDKAEGDQKHAFFRRTFEIEEGATIEIASLKMTADDGFVVFVNGRRTGHNDRWNVFSKFALTETLRPGKNVIAVQAWNSTGPAGLIASLRAKLTDGKIIDVKTDDTWKTLESGPPGWETLEFDDASWRPVKVVGAYGMDPWKKDVKDPTPPRQSLCMRKDFTLDKQVARARAYVSGLGIYVLRINGRRVGEDIFAPGWTHYYKRIQYQTYDVTDLLREGENAVGAILGNGWWAGGLGWAGTGQYSEGNLRLMLQLNVEYADGTREQIVTDDGWRAHPSPVTRNTYYHGETYDARLEMPGWDAPGFDANGWWETIELDESTPLVAQACETIQVTQELTNAQISQPEPRTYIFDFRQNAAGRVRLKVNNVERGTRIRLRFGEELDPNGRLYRDNYRSAEATDYYICKGGEEEIWEPEFTYRGFRYCELTGLPYDPNTETLTARVLHTATPQAGTFECSHWLINRILHNVNWGLRSNLHSVPTDCPQRDERLGWMGDAQAFAHTSCFLRDMGSFYTKWTQDIRDSQSPEGAVTDVSPAKVVKGAAKPGWGDAVVVMPYTVWRFYGDTRIIEENYDAMVGWVEYMRSQSQDDLYEVSGYGDWVAVQASPTEWIGSAYYYYSSKLLSEMAAAIGKSDDAEKYASLANRIAGAFNAKHLDRETNDYVTGTQTCNILPLFFSITPDDREGAVLANIVEDIEARGDHLTTGFLGTTYLMTLLADRGQQDLAWRLGTQTTYPSWGHMILHGATTIWERWDTDKQGPDMNSRNHFAFGTVARWFYEDLAGINLDPEVTGFKRFMIRPRPVGNLTFARATYPSIRGEVHSGWHLTDEGLVLDVTIPANTTAEVHVPTLGKSDVVVTEAGTEIFRDGRSGDVLGVRYARTGPDHVVFDVGAGSYRFEMQGK